MKSQPNRDYVSNDRVMTPPALCEALAAALQPSGVILEPCQGTGNFVVALHPYGRIRTCEIAFGRDFFAWDARVDWIVTNPPWSDFRRFLMHALTLADNVAFLVTVNHWWTKARVREVRQAGFGYRRLLLVDTPPEFPSSGFQLGMMHVQRGYMGPLHVEALPWRFAQQEAA